MLSKGGCCVLVTYFFKSRVPSRFLQVILSHTLFTLLPRLVRNSDPAECHLKLHILENGLQLLTQPGKKNKKKKSDLDHG